MLSPAFASLVSAQQSAQHLILLKFLCKWWVIFTLLSWRSFFLSLTFSICTKVYVFVNLTAITLPVVPWTSWMCRYCFSPHLGSFFNYFFFYYFFNSSFLAPSLSSPVTTIMFMLLWLVTLLIFNLCSFSFIPFLSLFFGLHDLYWCTFKFVNSLFC